MVFDRCTFQAAYLLPHQQTLLVTNATVHLLGGSQEAGDGLLPACGMFARNSLVTAVGTSFRGSSVFGLIPAGPAIVLGGGVFQASGIGARGGVGFQGSQSASAIVANGASVWISDSLLTARGPGACPVVPTGALLGVTQPVAPALGQTFPLQWQAQPGDLVGVLSSLDLATRPQALFAQPWWAPAGSPTAGLFVADAQGAASGAWALPADPAFLGLSLWFHSFAGVKLPLATAPVAGGVVRLGLDAGIRMDTVVVCSPSSRPRTSATGSTLSRTGRLRSGLPRDFVLRKRATSATGNR